jgi:hypothetical protein
VAVEEGVAVGYGVWLGRGVREGSGVKVGLLARGVSAGEGFPWQAVIKADKAINPRHKTRYLEKRFINHLRQALEIEVVNHLV